MPESDATTTPPAAEAPAMLTYAEAAQRTALPIGTLYALVSRKEIPHVRFGKRLVRFPVAELDAWIREAFVPSTPKVRTPAD
jgi:excisionase family DNA binding protein